MTATDQDFTRIRIRQLESANAVLVGYTSFIAHELRAPLTVAKGFLSLVHEGIVPSGEEAMPMIAEAYRGILALQERLEYLLQLAVEEGSAEKLVQPQASDPECAVQRIWAHMQAHQKSPVALEVGKLPAVGLDALTLERILYLVIGHAAQHAAGVRAARIAVNAEVDAEGVWLRIGDNGIELAQRGLDPGAVNSTGADESLREAGRLVRIHGGDMHVAPNPGPGVTFALRLPLPVIVRHTPGSA